jgi:hypothetical protein
LTLFTDPALRAAPTTVNVRLAAVLEAIRAGGGRRLASNSLLLAAFALFGCRLIAAAVRQETTESETH